MRILVTGGAGFLAQRIIRDAAGCGHSLVAIVRPGQDVSGLVWRDTERVASVAFDLAAATDLPRLVRILEDIDVVIHAAGSFSSAREDQQRDTVDLTLNLLSAMNDAGVQKLVLLSSMSVYGYKYLPAQTLLDEMAPLDTELSERDEYCRAKQLQEKLALNMAQNNGFRVVCLRLGAVYGVGRLWTARLGITRRPFYLLFGSSARVPLIYVDHAAEASLQAAEIEIASDYYCNNQGIQRGAYSIVNVVDNNLPTQREYFQLIKPHVCQGFSIAVPVPNQLLRLVAACTSAMLLIAPTLVRFIPMILRPAAMHARIKPVEYSNARLRTQLDWSPKYSLRQAIESSRNQAF